jgi:NADH-quinone oxidoreductase subunit F/NADP-reducing hydrogenase subunit HndC
MRLHQLVGGFQNGTAKTEDLDTIRDLSETMKIASLCGLGQATPVPVLTCLDNFSDAFEHAIKDNSCCGCSQERGQK